MSKFAKYLMIWNVTNSVVTNVLLAMDDGVLDGPEMLSILKNGLMALRIGGVSSGDIDRIQLVTNTMEYNQLQFKDGDGAIYIPKDILDKLKIDLS